jgi:Ca-activated chloride channel family protein
VNFTPVWGVEIAIPRLGGEYFLKMRMIVRYWVSCGLGAFALFAPSRHAGLFSEIAAAQDVASYNLNLPVDEVSVIFHTEDGPGQPVNDLKIDELSLLDNGKPPRRILAFQSLHDPPIRAGILMDTSQSMQTSLQTDRAIAIKFARTKLRQTIDRGFVMDFGGLSSIAQSWTNDTNALIAGIRNGRVAAGTESRDGGTAMFDSVYRACLNQFGRIDNSNSGNLILLFSDGNDNLSQADLRLAVDICQHTNTMIYVFRAESESGASIGPKNLADLASETGGRIFHNDDSDAKVEEDLRTIEDDLRNQYRLVYKPSELKYDGSFHRIELKVPERAQKVVVRSGYYAPVR